MLIVQRFVIFHSLFIRRRSLHIRKIVGALRIIWITEESSWDCSASGKNLRLFHKHYVGQVNRHLVSIRCKREVITLHILALDINLPVQAELSSCKKSLRGILHVSICGCRNLKLIVSEHDASNLHAINVIKRAVLSCISLLDRSEIITDISRVLAYAEFVILIFNCEFRLRIAQLLVDYLQVGIWRSRLAEDI